MSNKTLLKEIKTETPLPYREFSVGIYKERNRLVVRKFELKGVIRIPLDEEYVLNVSDAIVVMNIQFHKIHSFTLN